MKAVVNRRARIARVRKAQHLLASANAAMAENRVTTLETQAGHLVRLASDLDAEPGVILGAALSNAAELAQRLRSAKDGLNDAIIGARATALERSLMRIEARIKQESADRLGERARSEMEHMSQRKANSVTRRKLRLRLGYEGEQE